MLDSSEVMWLYVVTDSGPTRVFHQILDKMLFISVFHIDQTTAQYCTHTSRCYSYSVLIRLLSGLWSSPTA